MRLSESETNDNFSGKKELEAKEENLKEILNLFPSGILFYEPKMGITYKNEYFRKVCEEIDKSQEDSLKKSEGLFKQIQELKSNPMSSPKKLSSVYKSSKMLLDKFQNKDVDQISLAENLKKMCNPR